MLGALSLAQVNVVAMFEGASGCSLSVVVAGKDKTAALVTLHREFQLGQVSWPALPAASPAVAAAAPYYQPEPAPLTGIERSHVVCSRPVISELSIELLERFCSL